VAAAELLGFDLVLRLVLEPDSINLIYVPGIRDELPNGGRVHVDEIHKPRPHPPGLDG